jgi:signal transduction histidine kinase
MSAARWLGIIRWVLPLALAGVAIFFEWSEHIAREQEEVTPGFIGEVILFAIAGPVIVAFTLAWVARILRAYAKTSAELAVVNLDLEAKVIERTQHLEAATAQLAAANDDLAHANTELRQLDRLKSEFVSLVSHQLRAPLTNIRGALEIVGQDADRLPTSSQRTLQILTSESERLSRLIQTILDVSRIEAGKLTPRLGPVAVEPLLVRTSAATLDSEPGRPWALAVPPALPPAWADEVLLEEVIRNLLENAVQYTPPGASIEVVAGSTGGGIEIAVLDHGPGVSPDEHDRIFQSFHRLGEDDTTVKGYGLGLYFVDKLVRAMGGTVTLRSPIWPDAAAPGTRFTVTLPIASEEPGGGDEESVVT